MTEMLRASQKNQDVNQIEALIFGTGFHATSVELTGMGLTRWLLIWMSVLDRYSQFKFKPQLSFLIDRSACEIKPNNVKM